MSLYGLQKKVKTKMMSDYEFQRHFQIIHDKWDAEPMYPPWVPYIKANFHLLPIECVEMICVGLPANCGWSSDIIKAAGSYITEHFLLGTE